MSSDENIRAMLILDIIGRPAEHLIETLDKIIGEMRQEKNVVVKTTDIKEPTTMKENKEFFTTFAEIEVEVEDINYLVGLMFKFMPAHVEVISPEKIQLSNNGWSDILSEITRRLHSYDEVTKIIQLENQRLIDRIQKLTVKTSVKEIIPEQEGAEINKNSKGKKTGKSRK